MQRTIEKVFFTLIRFAINGTELCDDVKNLITPEVLSALLTLSRRHDLAHLIGDVLHRNGLLNELEMKKNFLRERNMAVYRYEQQQYEFQRICEIFEVERIAFIPLKGCVIRDYYPEPWMRTSCDIDILIQVDALEKAKQVLTQKMLYQVDALNTGHDISFFSRGGVHLELHYNLMEESCAQNSNEILRNVWAGVNQDGLYQKSMTSEMFYFYHIAHMAKHFEIGGCGVRPFLDLYFLKNGMGCSAVKCHQLLEIGGLLAFAKAMEKTADFWFDNGEQTDLTLSVQDYILYAGMYADSKNYTAVQQVRRGGKFKNIIFKIFLPYEQLKVRYPQLEEKKWLTPFYEVKRWLQLLFGKEFKNASRELNLNIKIKNSERIKTEKLLKDLGL